MQIKKKIRVIQLYLENIGLRGIERLEKVSDTTIINWIKKMGEIIKDKSEEAKSVISNSLKKEDIKVLECDEVAKMLYVCLFFLKTPKCYMGLQKQPMKEKTKIVTGL